MHVFFATTSALLLPLGVRTRHLWALNVEPVSPSVDLSAAERAAGELLTALGADLGRESLRETPRRIATLYSELLTPAEFDATTFPGEGVEAFCAAYRQLLGAIEQRVRALRAGSALASA